MNTDFSIVHFLSSSSISFCLSPSLCLERMDYKSCLSTLYVLSLDPGSANGDRLCKP